MVKNVMRASDIRTHNINMVLSEIYKSRGEGISQSSLVNLTGLKAPTLFRIFSELESRDLIQPIKKESKDDGKKGRKPLLYTVNESSLYSIAVEFWAGVILIGLFNFKLKRIASITLSIDENLDINDVIKMITKNINSIIKEHSINREKIIGISVAAPGCVNVEKGIVIDYPRIKGLNHFPLAEVLEKELDLFVIVHNNCSALAYGEYLYGDYKDPKGLFTFLLRRGVNGALVSENGIYITPDCVTLETGHIPISFDGPICTCKGKGCLQAYLLDLDSNPNTPLFSSLENKILNKDDEAFRILDKAAEYLSVGIRNLKILLTPSTILIECSSEVVAKELSKRIREKTEKLSQDGIISPVNIYGKEYSAITTQMGAVEILMKHYFSN
ncbi:MAG: ROK family protein [Sphaerochaetaceae bacterium]|nr:ROK family protein [Sphaerochaetaceae bacterium]